jgi:hypothetical protein
MSGPRSIPAEPVRNRVERVSQAVVHVDVRRSDDGFRDLRTRLLDWLREKAGGALNDAMLRGETDSLDLLRTQRVETVAVADGPIWAARQDDQDRDVPGRTWVTEAMLAATDAQTAQLGFRLHCVSSGTPKPFERSVPRFMSDIARIYRVWLDHAEIDCDAQPVETREDLDSLVGLLLDPRRRSPVIGISMAEGAGEDRPLIDADLLAQKLFSTAHVRLLTRTASFGLTDRVGKRFSVFNGAVRIWWADFSPGQDDPYDYPLWLAERVHDLGDAACVQAVAERVLKASAARRDADTAIPSFAEVRRAAASLTRGAAANSGRSAEEMLALYETEIARLEDDLKGAKAERDELVALADEERRNAIAERDEARGEIDALRARLGEMQKALRVHDQRPEIEIPDSFDGLAAWARLHVADTIEILPRALRAAKKSDFDNPPLAYQALLLLHEAYVPMRRSGSLVTREHWDTGLRQLGLECARTHGGTRAGENANDYFVEHDGRRREVDLHLKGSNSRDRRYGFRLYFFWDDVHRRAVVASLPSHLDNRLS